MHLQFRINIGNLSTTINSRPTNPTPAILLKCYKTKGEEYTHKG